MEKVIIFDIAIEYLYGLPHKSYQWIETSVNII